jgi:hypothetical protein
VTRKRQWEVTSVVMLLLALATFGVGLYNVGIAREERQNRLIEELRTALDHRDTALTRELVSPDVGLQLYDQPLTGVLNLAVRTGDVALARTALNRGADPDAVEGARGRLNEPALIQAVRSRQPAMVKFLLVRGVDANQTSLDGATALQIARKLQRAEIVKLLKTHGATMKPPAYRTRWR